MSNVFLFFNPFSVGEGGVDSTEAKISNVPYFEMKQEDGALPIPKKLYFKVDAQF